MKYYLVEGSEINCEVDLRENGMLFIEQLDKQHPYAFSYNMCSNTEQTDCVEEVWDSREYNDEVLENLKLVAHGKEELVNFLEDVFGLDWQEQINMGVEDFFDFEEWDDEEEGNFISNI